MMSAIAAKWILHFDNMVRSLRLRHTQSLSHQTPTKPASAATECAVNSDRGRRERANMVVAMLALPLVMGQSPNAVPSIIHATKT